MVLSKPEVKIGNFHDFYCDSIRVLTNGVIITKSIDGVVDVWSFEKEGKKDDAYTIHFAKLKTINTMGISDKIGYGKVRP
jgi:hypothetical protein